MVITMYKVGIKKGINLIKDLDNYTVVDIKTTGLNWNFNKILKISALKIRNKEVVAEFSKIINPHEPIPYFIKNLTGITDDMTEDAPELEVVLREFKDFLEDDIIVGHNVNFLYDDFVDTLRISRKLLLELKHHKLDDLTKYYVINIEH